MKRIVSIIFPLFLLIAGFSSSLYAQGANPFDDGNSTKVSSVLPRVNPDSISNRDSSLQTPGNMSREEIARVREMIQKTKNLNAAISLARKADTSKRDFYLSCALVKAKSGYDVVKLAKFATTDQARIALLKSGVQIARKVPEITALANAAFPSVETQNDILNAGASKFGNKVYSDWKRFKIISKIIGE